MRLFLACLVATAPALFAAPFASAAGSTVSVVGPLVDVRPTIQTVGAADATLRAARNETESFQIIVQAGPASTVAVDDIVASALSGPGGAVLPAANISIARARYYHVTVPSDGELWGASPCPSASGCDLPDALIPKVDRFYGHARNALPFTVPSGLN